MEVRAGSGGIGPGARLTSCPGTPRGHGGPFLEHPYTIPLLTIRNVNVNSIKGRGGALIRTPIYYLLEPTLTYQSQKHYVISPSQKGCFIRKVAFISTPFLGRQSYLSGDKLIPTILSMLLRSLPPFRIKHNMSQYSNLKRVNTHLPSSDPGKTLPISSDPLCHASSTSSSFT